ncbi:MAG TPA: hypothetical protein VNV25_25160 [Gemmatimonadaceae bacterium]|nr:hypothetical protein [Gemmatimonadaceae bacterium]
MTPTEFGRAIGWVGGCLYLVDWIEHRARAWWSRVKYERQQAKIEACIAQGGHTFKPIEKVPMPVAVDIPSSTWVQCERCGLCKVLDGPMAGMTR